MPLTIQIATIAVRTFQTWWRFHAVSTLSKLSRHDALSRSRSSSLKAEPLRRSDNSCHFRVQGCQASGRSFRGVVRLERTLLPRSQSVRSRVELLDAEVREVADRSTQLTADLPADHVGAMATRRSRLTCRSHWSSWFQLTRTFWLTRMWSGRVGQSAQTLSLNCPCDEQIAPHFSQHQPTSNEDSHGNVWISAISSPSRWRLVQSAQAQSRSTTGTH